MNALGSRQTVTHLPYEVFINLNCHISVGSLECNIVPLQIIKINFLRRPQL